MSHLSREQIGTANETPELLDNQTLSHLSTCSECRSKISSSETKTYLREWESQIRRFKDDKKKALSMTREIWAQTGSGPGGMPVQQNL
jgi:transcription initiation factor IIE alpha subunit